MSKKAKLTATMAAATAYAHEHGGELVRYTGGYWMKRDYQGQFHHAESFGAATVEGLVSRGAMIYSEWMQTGRGEFPIAAKINPEWMAAK